MLTASFTSRFPTRTEELLLECFSVPTKRLRAHQRQPSFAIVSEIAIGRVDGRFRGNGSRYHRRGQDAHTQLAGQRGTTCHREKIRKREVDIKRSRDGGFPFPISDCPLLSSLVPSLSLSIPLPPTSLSFFSEHFLAAAFLAWWIFARLMSFRHDSAVTVSE